MKSEKTVVSLKNYGKVHLKLNELLDERGMTRNYLARLVNTRFEVIDRWYQGAVDSLDLDILARICFVLDYEVEDIIEFRK